MYKVNVPEIYLYGIFLEIEQQFSSQTSFGIREILVTVQCYLFDCTNDSIESAQIHPSLLNIGEWLIESQT